jgi:hypothetical protein
MVHSSARRRRFFRLFVVRQLAEGVLTSMGVALLMLRQYRYRRHDISIPYSLVADLAVTIALAAAAVEWYALTVRWLEHRSATAAVPD